MTSTSPDQNRLASKRHPVKFRPATTAVLLAFVCCLASRTATAAIHRTANFEVEASTDSIAERIASEAESVRQMLARKWHGEKLPDWKVRCRIQVNAGEYRPGGATTVRYLHGHATTVKIRLTGPLDEILESVLPHEMTHAVLASVFNRPLPRWIDEGLAVLSEGQPAQQRQRLLLRELLGQNPPPLRTLIARAEYPQTLEQTQAVYLVGFSLADYLIKRYGRKRLIGCLTSAMDDDWESAVRSHFRYDSLETMERDWHAWLDRTSPAVTVAPNSDQHSTHARREHHRTTADAAAS